MALDHSDAHEMVGGCVPSYFEVSWGENISWLEFNRTNSHFFNAIIFLPSTLSLSTNCTESMENSLYPVCQGSREVPSIGSKLIILFSPSTRIKYFPFGPELLLNQVSTSDSFLDTITFLLDLWDFWQSLVWIFLSPGGEFSSATGRLGAERWALNVERLNRDLLVSKCDLIVA